MQHARNSPNRRSPSALAEYGTQQLELCKLSELTGDDRFARAALGAMDAVHSRHPGVYLLPLSIDAATGLFRGSKLSFGAMGDSYYEYLLKLWLLRGKRDDHLRLRWQRAMDEMISRLVVTSADGLMYVADMQM